MAITVEEPNLGLGRRRGSPRLDSGGEVLDGREEVDGGADE
jgi:hypothetical protein